VVLDEVPHATTLSSSDEMILALTPIPAVSGFVLVSELIANASSSEGFPASGDV
jgi:hypothetical protein